MERSELPAREQLQPFETKFGWHSDTGDALYRYMDGWKQTTLQREHDESKRLAVRRAFALVSNIPGPIRYLARDHRQVKRPKWPTPPIALRELGTELKACLDHLNAKGDNTDLLNRTKEVVISLLQHAQQALELRNLKEALVDSIDTIDRILTTSKPEHMSSRDWMVWNIAPLFSHSTQTSNKHTGSIGWAHLCSFLALYGYASSGSLLKKIYDATPANTPRDPRLSQHIAQHRQHRPVPFKKVLHGEAFKRAQMTLARSTQTTHK